MGLSDVKAKIDRSSLTAASFNFSIVDFFNNGLSPKTTITPSLFDKSISLKTGLEKTYKWIFDQILSKENSQKFTRSY